MANQLDQFPRFLLGRCRYARQRGIMKFKLMHPTGDALVVTLEHPDRVTVIRFPKATVEVPGMQGAGKARMRLATTEATLVHDMNTGIESNLALNWRG